MVLRSVLGLLALAAVAVGYLGTRPAPQPVVSVVPPELSARSGRPSGEVRLIGIGRRTTPFRADRRPPAERYGVARVVSPSATPSVPKPTLVLTGILWGSEPSAIIEGVPGSEGPVVVQPGQEFGPLRIIAIDSLGVVLRGLDTMWTLKVRQPW